MIAAAVLSMLMAVALFLRPESVLASGTSNSNTANLNRLVRVVTLETDSVMSFSFPFKESAQVYGISLYMHAFIDGVPQMHCDLPDECRLVYSITNEKGETVTSNSVKLNEIILDSAKIVENHFPIDAGTFEKGETLEVFFALADTPENVVVAFYGYEYNEDEEKDSLVLEQGAMLDDCVLLYRIIVIGNDKTAGMIFLIMAFVFVEGAVLLLGDKHATRE